MRRGANLGLSLTIINPPDYARAAKLSRLLEPVQHRSYVLVALLCRHVVDDSVRFHRCPLGVLAGLELVLARVAATIASVKSTLVVLLASCAVVHAAPLTCPSDGAAIVVDTERHRMALCEAGESVRELPVAIGGGGVDKQREGDRKTPLGSYSLGPPRESSKFHRFMEVGYPTRKQRAEGRTGGDVGIHGPSRKYRGLGAVSNWFDWTDGCIAVASDEAIDQVASWVTEKLPNRVVIQ